MNKSSLLKGYIYVILSAVIFGLMPLMAKFIYDDGVNAPTLVFLRGLLSIPFLALLAKLSGGSLKINPKALPSISITALMGCCITPLLLFSSYRFIPSGTATVFHFIYPAAVMIGELIFFKNKIRIENIISVLICVIGICLFYSPESKINLPGSTFAILSGITYAIYVILLSGFRYKEISGFLYCFYVACVCTVAIFLFCICTNCLMLPRSFFGWALSVIFAVSINVGAVVLFQKGTFIIGGSRASILSTFEPITGVITGALVFSEPLSLQTGIGACLVICASILIALTDSRKNAGS